MILTFNKENINKLMIKNLYSAKKCIKAIKSSIKMEAKRGKSSCPIRYKIDRLADRKDKEIVLNYFRNKGFEIKEDYFPFSGILYIDIYWG